LKEKSNLLFHDLAKMAEAMCSAGIDESGKRVDNPFKTYFSN